MNEDGVVEILRRHLEGKTQTDLAKEIGIGVQYLNDVLHGRRRPSDTILEYLGLKREIVRAK